MLSMQDIIGMCSCTEEEIIAVAVSKRVPDTIAAAMADYAINQQNNRPYTRKTTAENIKMARKIGRVIRRKNPQDRRKTLRCHSMTTYPRVPSQVQATGTHAR